MYSLKVLHDSDTALGIVGEGLSAPWAGGKYTPESGAGNEVEETIELILNGSDGDIGNAVSGLGRWLGDAGDDFHRVYLEMKTVSTGAAWRSRIMGGWIEYYPKLGGVFRGNGSEKVVMHIRREEGWEGPETALVLGNGRIVPHVTTGEVVNHSDGDAGDYNYLVVGAGVVGGDMPARCRLEVKNKNALYGIGRMYVSMNSHGEYFPTQEAEAASSGVGSNASDAGCSGGSYKALSWATAGETVLLSWALDTTTLNALKGREVRPMIKLRASAAYNDLLLKCVMKWNGSVIYNGPWVGFVAGRNLQRLGALNVPPGVMGHAGDYGNLTMELVGWQAGAVAKALDVDFMQLLPMDWERMYTDVSGVGAEQVVKDDGLLPGLWVEGSSGGKLPKVVGYGGRLELPAGVGFSLWFLHEDAGGVGRIGHLSEVKVWYRARKRIV